MPNDSPTLFGPGGEPISNNAEYQLGPNILSLPGTPEELFAQGFQATNPKTGQAGGSLPHMILATWASTSVTIAVLGQHIDALDRHASQLEFRVAAMERLLKRHNPGLHEEYLREVRVVGEEMRTAAMAQAQGQPQAPGDQEN